MGKDQLRHLDYQIISVKFRRILSREVCNKDNLKQSKVICQGLLRKFQKATFQDQSLKLKINKIAPPNLKKMVSIATDLTKSNQRCRRSSQQGLSIPIFSNEIQLTVFRINQAMTPSNRQCLSSPPFLDTIIHSRSNIRNCL